MPIDITFGSGPTLMGVGGAEVGIGKRVSDRWYVGATGGVEELPVGMSDYDHAPGTRLRAGGEARYIFGTGTGSASVNCGPSFPVPMTGWLQARAGARHSTALARSARTAISRSAWTGGSGTCRVGMYLQAGMSIEPTSAYGTPAARRRRHDRNRGDRRAGRARRARPRPRPRRATAGASRSARARAREHGATTLGRQRLLDQRDVGIEQAVVSELVIGVARHVQHARGRAQCDKLRGELAPAHPRHDHVGQQQIEIDSGPAASRSACSRIVGLDHIVASVAQHLADQRADPGFVLDDEDPLDAADHGTAHAPAVGCARAGSVVAGR